MKCDTFLNMPQDLRPKVWALNRWFFDTYGSGLEEEQAETIHFGTLDEVTGMFEDMVSRMGVPRQFTDNILEWRFSKRDLIIQILSQGPLKSDMYND